MLKPVLVLGYGNPSRGDDALGPFLLDFIERGPTMTGVESITDFQLQIEHALDLEGRELILFVDASVSCASAFDFLEIHPARDNSYTSHAMSPAAVLQVFESVTGRPPPPSFLLTIQGVNFELGGDLSEQAQINLKQSCRFAQQLLDKPDAGSWRRLLSGNSA